MNDYKTISFWMRRGRYAPGPRLEQDRSSDVVVVGGGFTGLWSAIHLKEADPTMDVVMLEQNVIGYGASGRNAGFALTTLERNLSQLLRRVGPEKTRAQHLALVETLREIEAFVRQEKIDADLTRTGLLTVSNGPEQDIRIEQDIRAAEELDLPGFRYLDGAECRELLHSKRLRCGHWEDHALMVDPAALVWGLKAAAQRRGVKIFEYTPVDEIRTVKKTRVEARTPYGTVYADRALLATNAYAHAIRALRPHIFTIYAYMIVTEPLTDEQWAKVGWERRMGAGDRRIMRQFHRPTPDGRILWGGRDAPFSPHGPDPRFDRDPRIFGRLEETFRWTFPQLEDVRIDHGWAGPVCGTVNCMPTLGWLKGERILYALGYAGHGVAPSELAGRMVRDLMLDRKTEITELPMVTHRPGMLPPEPLRRFILNKAQRLLQKADDTGGAGQGPNTRLALKVLQ